MVFSNVVFLFVFLPIVLLCYFIVPNRWKNVILLIFSLIFYAWGEPKYVFLMMTSILMNYLFGILIEKYRGKLSLKKLFLTGAIIGNILILGFFKYATFLVDNLNRLFHLSIDMEPIALPIGISFFTFQAMSYIIDVYRKDANVQRNLVSLSLYISLFPQLVAGPIVRYNTIADQIKKRIVNVDKFAEGVRRFIIGLTKKVIVANTISEVADMVYSTPAGELSVATAWIGVAAYGLQIYFDFSGYSDMAIGLGKMFGFTFLENFNYPYIAKSVTEFWSRWHISLATWFKDYVYIPMGGNRKGYYRTLFNLLIVWSITGFWHGASWTYVFWGMYFGIFIVLERVFLRKWLAKIYLPFQHIYIFLIVMIGWVFFKADDFGYSLHMLKVMFGFSGNAFVDGSTFIYLNDYGYMFIIGFLFSLPIVPYLQRKLETMASYETRIVPVMSIVVPFFYMTLFGISMILLVNSTYNPFIYFRF